MENLHPRATWSTEDIVRLIRLQRQRALVHGCIPSSPQTLFAPRAHGSVKPLVFVFAVALAGKSQRECESVRMQYCSCARDLGWEEGKPSPRGFRVREATSNPSTHRQCTGSLCCSPLLTPLRSRPSCLPGRCTLDRRMCSLTGEAQLSCTCHTKMTALMDIEV